MSATDHEWQGFFLTEEETPSVYAIAKDYIHECVDVYRNIFNDSELDKNLKTEVKGVMREVLVSKIAEAFVKDGKVRKGNSKSGYIATAGSISTLHLPRLMRYQLASSRVVGIVKNISEGTNPELICSLSVTTDEIPIELGYELIEDQRKLGRKILGSKMSEDKGPKCIFTMGGIGIIEPCD